MTAFEKNLGAPQLTPTCIRFQLSRRPITVAVIIIVLIIVMIGTLQESEIKQRGPMDTAAVKVLRLSPPTRTRVRRVFKSTMSRNDAVRCGACLGIALCLLAVAQVQISLVSEGQFLPAPLLESVPKLPRSSSRRTTVNLQPYLKDVKILLFVTTVFSRRHMNQFSCCWPTLMKQSALLPNVDIMIFSNNSTKVPDDDIINTRALFQKNPSFAVKHAPPDIVAEINAQTKANTFQMGANLGPRLAFQKGWFDDYDWVIRINPDVLIRNSTWLLQQLQNPNVEGIFHDCTPRRGHQLHTDFFAVRPKAVMKYYHPSHDAPFSKMELEAWSAPLNSSLKVFFNHEATAYKYFRPIMEAGKARFLPDAAPSNGNCRIRGATSSVYHGHESCGYVQPNVCNALENFTVA
jgi:hypothetical protein